MTSRLALRTDTGWHNEWHQLAATPRREDRPQTAVNGMEEPSSPRSFMTSLESPRHIRTGWGFDVPQEQPRPPTSLFSSLGVPPPGHHTCWKNSLYVSKWQGPQPGWGTHLLPPGCTAGPLSSSLGTKTSRPFTVGERSGRHWGAMESPRPSCRPSPRDPIHGKPPSKVAGTTHLWATSSSAFGNTVPDNASGEEIPVFGESMQRHCGKKLLGHDFEPQTSKGNGRATHTLHATGVVRWM